MAVGLGAISGELYILVAMLGVVAFAFSNNKRAIAFACIIALFFVPILKNAINEDRPCAQFLYCEADKGMPSGHATFAYIFAAGSMGSPAFFFFLPAAILVSISRVVWEFHTIEQVVAGAGLGTALFFVSKAILLYAGHISADKVHWRVKRYVKRRMLKESRVSGVQPR